MWLHFILIASGVFASFCWSRMDGDGVAEILMESEKAKTIGATISKSPEFTMPLTKECCTRPAIHSDYKATGSHIKIGELDAYQTGDSASKRVLLSVYDIFGYHPNTKQFCDQLAKAGFLVVMPDFFRGSPWNETNFPPKDRQVLLNWIGVAGSWPNVVEPDLRNIISHYRTQGVTSFGIFGFCWGGKMSILAGGSDLSSDIKGAALIHGSFVDEKDAENVKVPVLLLPSKTESDMIPIQKKIQERLGEDAAIHFRFEDMIHGFAAARGDFKDALTRTRVEEAIGHVSKFFNKVLPAA